MLFSFTRTALVKNTPGGGTYLPGSVYLVILGYLAIALVCIRAAVRRAARQPLENAPFARAQFPAWLALTTAGGLALLLSFTIPGILLLGLAQFIPLRAK